MLLNFNRLQAFVGFGLIFGVGVFLCPEARAETKPKPPKSAFSVFGMFDRDVSSKSFFNGKVVDVSGSENKAAPAAVTAPQNKIADGPVFVTSDPTSHITPPNEDPKVRINPEAPGPFIAMADAYQRGDQETASNYADQYVKYQLNLTFQVRELTTLIGEAMIRQGVIDEEDWVGVGQFLDYQMASAREQNGSMIRPTQEQVLKRIKPDTKNRAEIYYFFSLDCSYCREMTTDIERLWRVAKSDPKLKMAAFTLQPEPAQWINSFRSYSGLTLPILNGEELSKQFRVAMAPSVIVVSPTTKTAYLKTGVQDFKTLYEFVRTVQGLPTTISPEIAKVVAAVVPKKEFTATKIKGIGEKVNAGTESNLQRIKIDSNSRSAGGAEKF